jgi:hypothetical protein
VCAILQLERYERGWKAQILLSAIFARVFFGPLRESGQNWELSYEIVSLLAVYSSKRPKCAEGKDRRWIRLPAWKVSSKLLNLTHAIWASQTERAKYVAKRAPFGLGSQDLDLVGINKPSLLPILHTRLYVRYIPEHADIAGHCNSVSDPSSGVAASLIACSRDRREPSAILVADGAINFSL